MSAVLDLTESSPDPPTAPSPKAEHVFITFFALEALLIATNLVPGTISGNKDRDMAGILRHAASQRLPHAVDKLTCGGWIPLPGAVRSADGLQTWLDDNYRHVSNGPLAPLERHRVWSMFSIFMPTLMAVTCSKELLENLLAHPVKDAVQQGYAMEEHKALYLIGLCLSICVLHVWYLIDVTCLAMQLRLRTRKLCATSYSRPSRKAAAASVH